MFDISICPPRKGVHASHGGFGALASATFPFLPKSQICS